MSQLFKNWPKQKLSFNQKNAEWRKQHLDFSDKRIYYADSSIRKSFIRKRTNYNLVNGILDLNDMSLVLNPDNTDASYIPENIQHYPIMLAKLNVLRGEELKRRFDWRLIITNPNAITEIENNKKDELMGNIQELIQSDNQDEESFNAEMDKMAYYYTYEWQDAREERGNLILNHYIKELQMKDKFNDGFVDAMIAGEEIYQCDIVGGEPTFQRINPLKCHIFKNGYSNRIEDADILTYVDFWSPGRIIDTFYDVLSDSDIDYIDNLPQLYSGDNMANIDERNAFINLADINGFEGGYGTVVDNYSIFAQTTGAAATTNYFDNNGNIRVVRTYWRSKRKIKKIKSYNPETGEEEFDFYPENYQCDKSLGQEEEIFWINEAWEGTKIGKEIYVNMRPRIVQYNRLSNPSRCHFGFVGTVYNTNDSKPFSLVDVMKPYQYLYNALHDRLNKAIAANWGKLVKLDLAMIPKGWEVDKWLYYAKVNHIAVVDSFKEGNIGAATGKLSGMMQQSSGVLDLEQGNYIQQHINLLEFVKMEMSEAAGISKQREGQISASETVGGVERANLQSSHITEWLFAKHDDVKKRALECFLETAKAALKGNNKKFQYILSTGAIKIADIDGDEFAECDYGLVLDNSNESQKMEEGLLQLAHAAMQNQMLSFGAMMKILASPSMSEVQRIIEKDEKDMNERRSKETQEANKIQMQELQYKKDVEQQKMQLEDELNQRDNETRLLIAEMSSQTEVPEDYSREELNLKIKQLDDEMELKRSQHNHKVNQDKIQNQLKEKDLEIKKINKTKPTK